MTLTGFEYIYFRFEHYLGFRYCGAAAVEDYVLVIVIVLLGTYYLYNIYVASRKVTLRVVSPQMLTIFFESKTAKIQYNNMAIGYTRV